MSIVGGSYFPDPSQKKFSKEFMKEIKKQLRQKGVSELCTVIVELENQVI